MKLSEMTTGAACDCLLEIAVPVANIAEDESLVEVIRGFKADAENLTYIEIAAMVARKIIPLALKNHREDMFVILSALTGKTAAQIESQPITQTIMDARGIVDRDLIDFFTSSAPTAGSAS